MIRVNKETIVESLEELANERLQTRLWLSDGSEDVSSYIEAVERMYTDSGLSRALASEEIIFSNEVDQTLRELRNLLAKIDGTKKPADILSSAEMSCIRRASTKILKMLEEQT